MGRDMGGRLFVRVRMFWGGKTKLVVGGWRGVRGGEEEQGVGRCLMLLLG